MPPLAYAAARNDRPRVVKVLLRDPRTNLEAQGKTGGAALTVAASKGNAKVVRMLLGAGAQPQSDVVGDHSTLPVAVDAGNPTIVRALLQEHIEVPDLAIALHRAACKGDAPIVAMIMRKTHHRLVGGTRMCPI